LTLELKMKRQDCKIGTVWGRGLSGGVNGGDEGEGIWLMASYASMK
jgi:hypothetical protein